VAPGAIEPNTDPSRRFGNLDSGRVKPVPLQGDAEVDLNCLSKRPVTETNLSTIIRKGVERRHVLGGAKIDRDWCLGERCRRGPKRQKLIEYTIKRGKLIPKPR
jgi:hypothetical protein